MGKGKTQTSINEAAETGTIKTITNEDLGEMVQSINVLITAANMAQSKGLFNLEEASQIWSAIQRIQEIISPNQ